MIKNNTHTVRSGTDSVCSGTGHAPGAIRDEKQTMYQPPAGTLPHRNSASSHLLGRAWRDGLPLAPPMHPVTSALGLGVVCFPRYWEAHRGWPTSFSVCLPIMTSTWSWVGPHEIATFMGQKWLKIGNFIGFNLTAAAIRDCWVREQMNSCVVMSVTPAPPPQCQPLDTHGAQQTFRGTQCPEPGREAFKELGEPQMWGKMHQEIPVGVATPSQISASRREAFISVTEIQLKLQAMRWGKASWEGRMITRGSWKCLPRGTLKIVRTFICH